MRNVLTSLPELTAALLGISISISVAASSTAALAVTSSAFLRMPSRFTTTDLSLSSRGLGEICYARDLMPDGTVCNPAFADEVQEGFLMGRLYVGNGYAAMSSANQLIFQPISREFLESLFRRDNVISLEGEATIIAASKYVSASFTPYRVQYFSEIHNPNYAVLAIQASVERAFEVQGGAPLAFVSRRLSEVSVGAKLRVIERNYVSGKFALAQALVEEPRTLLPVKQQYAFYLDPSIGWRPRFGRWRLWSSVGLVNVGKASNEDELYRNPLDVAAGAGVEAPLPYGRLRLGVDLVNLIHGGEGAAARFRTGASYRLGIIEGMAGFNENAITGGLLFAFQVVQAGVIYEFTRSELNGGVPENRISTEIAVKL